MPNNSEVLRNLGWAYCMVLDTEENIKLNKEK
jgi:hypothetical protein